MSTPKVDCDQLTVRRLDENVDLSDFDCSLDDDLGLNDFVHNEAMQYQCESLGVTHLFYYKGCLVGYVTVAMSSIFMTLTRLVLPKFLTHYERHYPALLGCRLGVANIYRKHNIGHCICLWMVGLAKQLSGKAGCRFVILMTKQSKVEFYTKCGFEICPRFERKEDVLMYFQIF